MTETIHDLRFLDGIDPTSLPQPQVPTGQISADNDAPAGAEFLTSVAPDTYNGLGGLACLARDSTQVDDDSSVVSE